MTTLQYPYIIGEPDTNAVRKQEYKTLSLHVTGTSYSWIWGCMLGSMHRRTDKCVRPSTKESCPIYWSYE